MTVNSMHADYLAHAGVWKRSPDVLSGEAWCLHAFTTASPIVNIFTRETSVPEAAVDVELRLNPDFDARGLTAKDLTAIVRRGRPAH